MMKKQNTIPILIGVSGHRDLRPGDREALYGAVKGELEKLRALCPSSPLALLCSLAEGADQLCARAARELGIPITAVLPMAMEDYLEDFSPQGAEELRAFCAGAERVLTAPFTEAEPAGGADRDFRYRQAGIYIAERCHVLLALWDGRPGPASACGTAAAVGFSLEGKYWPADRVSLRSGANAGVLHILTPRGEDRAEGAGEVRRLGDWAAVETILRRTEDYNRQARDLGPASWRILPEHGPGDGTLDRMEEAALGADSLSLRNAGKYRRVLALLALASTLLTLAFLFYDEAEAIWLILVCGLLLVFAWLCRVWARRSDCHRRFIEYRALAECLRVQACLRYAGSGLRAATLLSWSQQEETAWIMAALCALDTGEEPGERHDILACWVEDQLHYHEKAARRTGRAAKLSDRVVGTALCLSILLYLAGLAFELLWGGRILRPLLPAADPELCRTVLKIAMGGISAATLFISNYYGRLSLPRVLADHRKMARFYGKMAEQLRQRGQTETLLRVLAREELAENGNWVSYQSDNTPDISL